MAIDWGKMAKHQTAIGFWWYGCCFFLKLWMWDWNHGISPDGGFVGFFFHQPSETLGQANMARHGTSCSQLNWFLFTFFCQVYKLIDCWRKHSGPQWRMQLWLYHIFKPQAGTAASLVSVNAAAWPWMNQLRMAVSIGKMKMRVSEPSRTLVPCFALFSGLFGDGAWKFRITTWKPHGLNQFDVWTLGLWLFHPWDRYQCITSHRQTFTGASIGIDSLNRYMGARINGRMPSGNQTFVWGIPELSGLVGKIIQR